MLTNKNQAPDFYFHGCPQDNNGAKLFIDIIWWLPRHLYNEVYFISDEPSDPSYLNQLKLTASVRGINFRVINHQPDTCFSTPAVFFQPIEITKSNNFLIEKLLNGYPIIINHQSNLSNYLKENLPLLPTVNIQIDYSRIAALQITALLIHYEDYCQHLKRILLNNPPEIKKTDWQSNENYLNNFPTKATQFSLPVFNLIKKIQRKSLKALGINQDIQQQIKNYAEVKKQYAKIAKADETHLSHINQKIHDINALLSLSPINKIKLYKELARLELKRHDPIAAISYSLKIMKSLGNDYFNDLPFITKTLKENSYEKEADIANAIFNTENNSYIQCKKLLDNTTSQLQNLNSSKQYEFLDDRRNTNNAKLTVLVSLFDAANQLRPFMHMIKQQTLFKYQLLEIIFIDRNSSTDEYQIFKDEMHLDYFPALYIRLKDQQSVFAAWNHGLNFARGKYIACMDVNEGMYPFGLEQLAIELDNHPDIDWVVANAINTALDEAHIYDRDINILDRQGYQHHWFYLDNDYLSHTAALYRRTLHERFGYYDGTFKFSGAKEFINRVSPFIKTKNIVIPLGILVNSHVPKNIRMHIENLRAYDLYTTSAGIEHVFQQCSHDAINMLLTNALSYRMCRETQKRTNFELALKLTEYLANKTKLPQYADLATDLTQMLSAIRTIDFLKNSSFSQNLMHLIKLTKRVKEFANRHQKYAGSIYQYHIFNDSHFMDL